MPKVIDAKSWVLTPAADGRRYSKYPGGTLPTTLATWNLPATISAPAGSSAGVRQYAVNATGWTIAVTGLAAISAGLSYDSGTETIVAAVGGTAGTGTATFTLSKIGETNVVATTTVALTAVAAEANLVFTGDFRNGNFSQWKSPGGSVSFWLCPSYGRPIRYSTDQAQVGNGELLSLVAATERTINVPGVGDVFYPAGPTRGTRSEYASKHVIKNSVNGTEPADCAPNNCTRRRVDFGGEHIQANHGAYPHRQTSWGSMSLYLPDDFNPVSGNYMGFIGIKPQGWDGSGILGLNVKNLGTSSESWEFEHRWHIFEEGDGVSHNWWTWYVYDKDSPSAASSKWKDVRDYPNEAASRASLGSVLKGGWTDWVWQIHMDERTEANGGVGFWNVWKRDGSGPWVHALRILPKTTTMHGQTNTHGIGYNITDYSLFGSLYSGSNVGIDGTKATFWDAPNNTTMYLANCKIGNANATFADMSPEGSIPPNSWPEDNS